MQASFVSWLTHEGGLGMFVARVVGLMMTGIAAVLVTVTMAPTVDESALDADYGTFQTAIATALSDYEANDALTDSAPQQQVVNGWIARDLLTIAVEQNEAIGDVVTASHAVQVAQATDPRPALLLMLGVLAIVWLGVTLPRPAVAGTASATVRGADPAQGSDAEAGS